MLIYSNQHQSLWLYMLKLRADSDFVIRNLNRRNSALRSLLVSVDLSSDETFATGSNQRFLRGIMLKES